MVTRGDDRGVSELAGVVLVFAFIIIALGVYQATVVPAQNERAEFDHNLRLQSDMQDLREAILNAPSQGTSETVTIELGLRYPTREILINPAPAVGTIETDNESSAGPNMTVANATSSGEVADYWDGSSHRFSTTTLTYRPGYNQYTNAPSTHYENSIVYNRFNDTLIPLTTQSVIDGQRISLIAINGTLSRNSIQATSIDVRSISPGHRTVAVTDSGGPVTIVIPTRLDSETWQSLLEGEFVANGTGGHIQDISVTPVPNSVYNLLRIELETGVTYELNLAEVAVGQNSKEPNVGYVTTVSRNVTSMTTDEEQLLIAEVRSRFDNPVSGVDVTFTTDIGSFSDGSNSTIVTSDTDGRASVILTSSVTGNATVRAGLDTDGDGSLTDELAELWVEFTVFISSS